MEEKKKFRLAPGGPVDRLLASRRGLEPENRHLRTRAVIAAAVAWVPLFVMAMIQPNPDTDIPFVRDIAAHVRFLLCIPLLVFAEGMIVDRTAVVVDEFLASGLVGDQDAARFDAAVQRAQRMLDSWIADLLLLTVTAWMMWITVNTLTSESSIFWFERHTRDGGQALSAAGWWYAVVSTPLFLFIILRWIWRYIVWWWLLGRFARLDLRLTGSHPDRMGGLGFVGYNHTIFSVVTFAYACVVSGAVANRILNGDATLGNFQTTMIILGLAAVIIGIAPMLVFTPGLILTKRTNWVRYSRFASDFVLRFEKKWMGPAPAEEDVLSAADISSLADLAGGFERMAAMRPFVIDRRLVLSFVVAVVLPAVPLVFTMISFKDIIKTVVSFLM